MFFKIKLIINDHSQELITLFKLNILSVSYKRLNNKNIVVQKNTLKENLQKACFFANCMPLLSIVMHIIYLH